VGAVSRSRDTALTLLDTPGTPSFQAEAKQAAPIADAVLWVVDSSAGVKKELEKLWEYAAERSLPGLIVISGLGQGRGRLGGGRRGNLEGVGDQDGPALHDERSPPGRET